MDRRRFVATLASGAVVASRRAGAQPADKVARVGILSLANRPTDAELQSDPWRLEMERLGWVEGRNLVVERRYADGRSERVASHARELVDARVDVIVTLADRDAVEARKLTSTLPILTIYAGLDPVADGLVASFARPGGNVTGVSRMLGETRAKRLEMIKTLLPTASRVAVLYFPFADAVRQKEFEAGLRGAARSARVELAFHRYGNQDELMAAFPMLAAARTPAFLLEPIFQTYANRRRISEIAIEHRLPGMFTLRRQAQLGSARPTSTRRKS